MSARPLLTPEVLVPRLGDYLVEKGLLSQENLKKALAQQQALRIPGQYPPQLGQILVNMGMIDRASLDQAITEQIIQLREALQRSNVQLEQRVEERTADLELALRKLNEVSQLKSNFVANISHELRTPLTHLKGYLELMISETFGEINNDMRQSLEIMNRATDRLGNLIEDLILFSTTERGALSLNIHPFSIQDLLREVERRTREKAIERKITLQVQSAPGIPLVEADPEKILWVVLHLIDNSLKFTPTGGTVQVRADCDGALVRVSVTDTGIGIPADKYEEIFEPFHQLDGSSTRKYGGTGLGLALVKKIIEAHGSVVHVVSRVKFGSRFEFLLNSIDTSIRN